MPDPNVRPTNPDYYQRLSVPVAAMRKAFADRVSTGLHHHRRHQLIYAVGGTMRIRIAEMAWFVPPSRALFMPAELQHNVTAFGDVDMCTLYVEPDSYEAAPPSPLVITVSPLLRELIVALLHEPPTYECTARAGKIADLILDEITRGQRIDLSIPMPRDSRLLRVCNTVLEDPISDRSFESLADEAGASARTLARLFQRELKMGFAAWRQQVRFRVALGAIAGGEPIGSIARNCGYQSASAFSAAFKRVFGVPPSQM
ncbi:MAG: AraC family transcriptional regulator [Hyphomicrobiaceae bacterium]